ncbi:MAG: hypothetical protein IJ892_06400 [Prevotella sp.]|nr:hypothetical protein [Prevotella sp.]
MQISSQIGHSHLEQMSLIHEFVCHFDVDLLLYAINGKHLDEDAIVSLTADINEYNAKLLREKQYLFKRCRTFNKEFAHEDNYLVDTSAKISRNIRSGCAGARKVIKHFCKVSRKQLPPGKPAPQAYERSMICTNNYVVDMWGLSSYPPCVLELFTAMLKFYENLNECIEEALRTIKEEKATKGNHAKCLEILINDCERSRKAQAHLIEAMQDDPETRKAIEQNKILLGDEENPVLRDYKKSATNKEQFAGRYFHNCSPKDIGKITIYNVVAEASGDPMMAVAITTFGNDAEFIQRINYVIEHFDELLPPKCKNGKIPALYLYFFYDWCGGVGYQSFLNYFNKYYKEHHGRWDTIGRSALCGACAKDTTNKEIAVKKKEFLAKIDALLSKKFAKQ